MQKQISFKLVSLIFGVLVICFLAGFYILAWTGPTATPPGDNVPTPLNVGPDAQTKQGPLIVNTDGIEENGLVVDKGKLCIGADCKSSWSEVGGTLTCEYVSKVIPSGGSGCVFCSAGYKNTGGGVWNGSGGSDFPAYPHTGSHGWCCQFFTVPGGGNYTCWAACCKAD